MLRSLDDHLFGPGPKRILSLDGGGVRGLITLGLLQRVEDILKARAPNPTEFRLADYFDLIGGTSTGGIIATLLALRYRVEQIREIYREFCPSVFRNTVMRTLTTLAGLRSSKFDVVAFEANVDKVLVDYMRDHGLSGKVEDLKLGSDRLSTGLGIVMKRIDTGSVWALTNNPRMKYWDPASPLWADEGPRKFFPNGQYALKDLVRATASAPFYLDSVDIRISKEERGLFLDGGASPFNNPALELFLMTTLKHYDDNGQLDAKRPFSPFGFDWETGENSLLVYSVGTGAFRSTHDCDAFQGYLNWSKARHALTAMIDDSMKSSLIWCQALSQPTDPFRVDGNLKEMRGLRITPQKFMTFKRVEPRLDRDWSEKHLGIGLLGARLGGVRSLDNASRRNLDLLQKIGEAAAPILVSEADFPKHFDPTYQAIGTVGTHSWERKMPNYTIETTGPGRDKPRIVAESVLSPADFRDIAGKPGNKAVQARKTALIAARQAAKPERIATQWNGQETVNTAEPGDWIVTSLSADGTVMRDAAGHANSYVIRAGNFPTLYKAAGGENEFGSFYAATGTVEAIHFAGGFDIMGPWGERQTAPDGYLVLNGKDVYGNNAETFRASFAVIG